MARAKRTDLVDMATRPESALVADILCGHRRMRADAVGELLDRIKTLTADRDRWRMVADSHARMADYAAGRPADSTLRCRCGRRNNVTAKSCWSCGHSLADAELV